MAPSLGPTPICASPTSLVLTCRGPPCALGYGPHCPVPLLFPPQAHPPWCFSCFALPLRRGMLQPSFLGLASVCSDKSKQVSGSVHLSLLGRNQIPGPSLCPQLCVQRPHTIQKEPPPRTCTVMYTHTSTLIPEPEQCLPSRDCSLHSPWCDFSLTKFVPRNALKCFLIDLIRQLWQGLQRAPYLDTANSTVGGPLRHIDCD